MHKIAIAAVAGSLVSTAGSFRRNLLERLILHPKRQRQLNKLKAWYDTQMRQVDEFAATDQAAYIEAARERLLKVAKAHNYSDEMIDVFLKLTGIQAREVIATNYKAQITKLYCQYLYGLDDTLAFEMKNETARLMGRVRDAAQLMGDAGYPTAELFKSLKIEPPYE